MEEKIGRRGCVDADGGIEEGNQRGGEGGEGRAGKGRRVGKIWVVRWVGKVGRENEGIGAVGRGEG